MTVKSLQAMVHVFFASNTVRRNVATHAINYLSTSSEQRTLEKSLSTGQSFVVPNPTATVGFVLGTNKPVTVIATPRAGGADLVIAVRKFLMIDQDFSTIEITAAQDATQLKIQIA